jgi:CHRD domain
MKKPKVVVSALLLTALAVVVVAQGPRAFKALMTGFQEVPVVSTVAQGNFRAEISNNEDSINYELSYADLEGNVTQSHIHVGQPAVNGGISVWLCARPERLPAGTVIPPNTQMCPEPPATITGTITAANVIGPTGQGVAPGEFAELVRAIRAGATYANVHSTKFPGGEIRSQIGPGLSTKSTAAHEQGEHHH